MDRNFLKNTKSLCSVCLEEIDAQLFLEDGKVIITKECRNHGKFNDMVDPKAELYLKMISRMKIRHSPYGIVIPVTFRCNLNCKWCYLPDRITEISSDSIRAIIDNCRHRYIVFSGGEPTLRDDLFELIAYVRRYSKRFIVLLTNGIKLANIDYIKRLKEAGLQYVIISFNGFSNEIYRYLNDNDLLELKLKALQNLKKLKLWTILSMTLAKGLNEDEFYNVYRYGIRNIDFIRQIRLRNFSEIGLYEKRDHIYLSDMVELVSKATSFSIDELLQSNLDCNGVFKTGNYFVVDVFETLKSRYSNSLWKSIRYWLEVVKLTGFVNAWRMYFEPKLPREIKTMFRIEIFSWPTAGNIDLTECRLFCIDHVTNNGKILPFWEALYKNDRLRGI